MAGRTRAQPGAKTIPPEEWKALLTDSDSSAAEMLRVLMENVGGTHLVRTPEVAQRCIEFLESAEKLVLNEVIRGMNEAIASNEAWTAITRAEIAAIHTKLKEKK